MLVKSVWRGWDSECTLTFPHLLCSPVFSRAAVIPKLLTQKHPPENFSQIIKFQLSLPFFSIFYRKSLHYVDWINLSPQHGSLPPTHFSWSYVTKHSKTQLKIWIALGLQKKKEPKQAETKAHSPVTQSQPRHRQVVGVPSCSCRLSALSSISYLCCWGASALALCQLVRQRSRAQQEKVTTASTPPQPRAHPAPSPLAFLGGLPWPSVALEK